jgi:mannose-6-phosphate isomerase-like protein (cupin superfamily)
MSATDLARNPLHLGLGASVHIEPAFEGDMHWYEAYAARHSEDGFEGRLVAMHTFTESWPQWEMHPNGAEVVICTAGAMTLHQEKADGTRASVTIGPGECAINEPGTWHTADVEQSATALFITSGLGTQHRPRT